VSTEEQERSEEAERYPTCDMLVAEKMRAPSPRSWVLPEEPGPEVTKLTAVDGDLTIERDDGPGCWVVRSTASGRALAIVRWYEAIGRYSPLTDATQERTP